MKSTLLASALVVALATSASAIELGGGLQLNTSIDGEWNTGTELFTTTVTPTLMYSPMAGLDVWADTELNVYDGTNLNLNSDVFTGINIGADYILPAMGPLGAKAYIEAGFNSDWDYTRTLLGFSLNF